MANDSTGALTCQVTVLGGYRSNAVLASALLLDIQCNAVQPPHVIRSFRSAERERLFRREPVRRFKAIERKALRGLGRCLGNAQAFRMNLQTRYDLGVAEGREILRAAKRAEVKRSSLRGLRAE